MSRREMLRIGAAWGSVLAAAEPARPQVPRARPRGSLWGTVSQHDLLRFRPKGQVTILHTADLHAQLLPVYLREPSGNLGVGEMAGQPPHITDRFLLERYAVEAGGWRAYALSSADFQTLAPAWGQVGGMDRIATLVKAIRADRGADRVLLLDGGDALQGSYTALQSQGGDMIAAMEALGVEAMTGHWELTLGAARIAELFGPRGKPGLSQIPFLAANVTENELDEPVFHGIRHFEKGGVRIAVIGQAFPHTAIAHPRWMFPRWSMGLREVDLARQVESAREGGAEVVVLLSHNGFDVDRKLAGRVPGIDVILTAHTHDALPEPTLVGRTLLVASGSHGKFLSRLDLEVKAGRVAGYTYALIPVLADAILPDKGMTDLVWKLRAPHYGMLETELARTTSLLYRRDTFSGTLDDLIIAAMLEERDAEIALSPGFRWGTSLLPGEPITWEDVYNATAITYPACYRTTMTGALIREILEDVADNVFNPDPYYQQGGDMVRVGGLRFTVDVWAPMGRRIDDLVLARSGERLEPGRSYSVTGWASVRRDIVGPPIWDVVGRWLTRRRTISAMDAPHGASIKPRGSKF